MCATSRGECTVHQKGCSHRLGDVLRIEAAWLVCRRHGSKIPRELKIRAGYFLGF